jgi:phosphatidate cytidylyltransferase
VRQRSISAVGVVIVGIVPAIMGGPVFAVVAILLCLLGLNEYNAMANRLGHGLLPTGYPAIVLFGLAGWFGAREEGLLAVCAISAGIPLIWAMFRPNLDGAFVAWALNVAGVSYLGLPLFAAISLRTTDGPIEAHWLDRLASTLSFGWDADSRGLSWLLLIIVVTWLSDTGAYLIGRATGHRPLIPRISPKKTVEGLAGGLACAALTAVIANAAFGLDLPWPAMLFVGLVIAVIGVFGDLAESLLKRQAGVKDSGTLIPGHGGMLDRLDALLFTWTAGWFMATLLDRWF